MTLNSVPGVPVPGPTETVSFALDEGGPLRLTLESLPERTVSAVLKRMDPYGVTVPASRTSGEVVLRKREHPVGELAEMQRPAGDGLITGFDGSKYHLLQSGSTLTLPADPIEGDTYEVDETFDIGRAWRRVVLPALQMAALRGGGVAVHSSSVQIAGRGVVIAGWSESGKTETALALSEGGGLFLSDKWTVLQEGSIYAFPISAGIRSWVLDFLPNFRKRLTNTTRIRLGVSSVLRQTMSTTTKALADTKLAPWASRLTDVVGLADRASLSPSRLSRALGQSQHPWSCHLDIFVVLTHVPGEQVRVERCQAGWAAQKMARSAAYERRGFFDLFERASYASPQRSALPTARVLEMEESRLEDMLENVQTLQVRAPFPVDPRKVADAIQECL